MDLVIFVAVIIGGLMAIGFAMAATDGKRRDDEEKAYAEVEKARNATERALHELEQHLRSQKPIEPEVPRAATSSRAENDPYVLLNVRHGCSPIELSDAWRKATKQWHPDRLDDMAPELKRMANDRLAAINHAYQTLKQQIR